MIKTGALANVIGVLVINVMLNTWGAKFFNFSDESFTEWADGIVSEETIKATTITTSIVAATLSP